MGDCAGRTQASSLQRTHGDDLLRRAGFDEVVAHIAGINQAIGESHKALRANERARALELQPSDPAREAAIRDIGRAQRHAREARAARLACGRS